MIWDKIKTISRLRATLKRHKQEYDAALKEHDRHREALLSLLEDLDEERHIIKQGRQEWNAVFDAVRDPIFLHDNKLRIVRVNRAYAERAGLAFHEIIGRPYWELFPKLPGPLAACRHKDGVGMQEQDIEEELALENGEVWISHSFPVTGTQGDTVSGVHILMDITARRRAEQALRKSLDLLHTIVENIPIRIFWKDNALRYLGCNSLFARDAGKRSPEALLGKDDTQMAWHEQAGLYQADDRRVIASDTPKLGYEEPQTTPDGHTIWLRTSKVPLKDADGKAIGILGIYDDITERKRLEEDRLQTLQRTQAQLEATGAASVSAALIAGEVAQFAREMTELVVRATGVERANVWLFNDDESELQCIDCFETTPARHTAGMVLKQENFRNEFEALKHTRFVDADEPLTDPRTAGYAEGYLKPLHITSMLDAVVHAAGKNLGLLCLEHVDTPHRWEQDEITFACQMADKIGLAIVHDARQRAEANLLHANRALRTLSAGNGVLVHSNDEATLLRDMCRTVIEQGNYRLAWVGLVEHDAEQRVRPVASAGDEEGYLESVQISWADNEHGQGPTGSAVRTGTTQVAHNLLTDPRYAPWREQAVQRGYASSIALPLKRDNGEVFCVLNIYAAQENAFDAAEVRLLQELADDLAYGILNLRTEQERNYYHQESLQSTIRLKESLIGTIRAIALTVEKRDPYTAGHQNRVAELAVAIAGELGLDPERIQGLQLGGMIHDIGKIYVPAEILSRPGRLSAAEFEIIKSHPEVGYDILKDVKFPWPVADIVLQHHERLDGSGYPRGLKGDEIILEARILAVADVVEAITAHRPYRAGLGVDVALDEINKNRGKFYDPAIVDACLRLFREQDYQLNITDDKL